MRRCWNATSQRIGAIVDCVSFRADERDLDRDHCSISLHVLARPAMHGWVFYDSGRVIVLRVPAVVILYDGGGRDDSHEIHRTRISMAIRRKSWASQQLWLTIRTA